MISIVIPVYNSEKFLASCMDSVLTQSYQDIQIIAVDDGSTDRSSDILDDYANRDSRVLVIHQKNAGVSSARNKGIRQALGEWMLFVDSDDQIEPNYCQRMLDVVTATGADVVIGCPEKEGMAAYELCTVDQKEKLICSCLAFDEMTFDFNIDAPWGKLFRTDVIKKNNIHFPENLKRSEDAFFCMEYYYHAKRIGYINWFGYQYNVRENSLSKHYGAEVLSTLEQVLQTNLKWVSEHGKRNTCYEKALWFRVLPGVVECEQYYFLHPNNQQPIKKKMREYQSFLNRLIIKSAIKKLCLKDVEGMQYKRRLALYKLHLGGLFLWMKGEL